MSRQRQKSAILTPDEMQEVIAQRAQRARTDAKRLEALRALLDPDADLNPSASADQIVRITGELVELLRQQKPMGITFRPRTP